MQGERLRSHDFGTGRTVLPLFVIIKPIVGVATVTFGPELAGLVISGPVESPQQVTGLHEVITARVACIIITAFLGTRQAGIGGQFKEFPHLLGEVQATGNTVEAVHLQTSFVLGIGKGSVIVGILRSTADGYIVGLVNGGTEICLVPIVVFASTPGVVVLKDIDVLVSSRTICGKLVAMFVETAVQLAYGIGCRLFVRFALTACTGIVKYGVEHIHILLYAGRFIVVRCPAGREAHFGFQRHHRLANLSFFGSNQNDAVCRTRPIKRAGRRIFQYRNRFDVFRVQRIHDVVGRIELTAHLPRIARRDRNTVHYIQRFIPGIHRTYATDADGRCGTRLAGIIRQLQARHFTVQRVFKAGRRNVFQRIRFH